MGGFFDRHTCHPKAKATILLFGSKSSQTAPYEHLEKDITEYTADI